MPRRRIAIVTDWYPSPERPVAGVFVAEQARAVASRHDVVVIVAPAAGSRIREPYAITESDELGWRTLRIRHRPSRVPKLAFAFRIAGTLAALRRLRRSGFAPDLLHAHIFGPGLLAVLVGLTLRIPVVVSEQFSGIALGTVRRGERRIARFVYRRADLVCPASDDLARRLAKLAPAARLRVVPNAVDIQRFRPGRRVAGEPILALAVGSLKDTKGIPELLDAFARLRIRRDRVVLELVGDGPERERYERRAAELGLGDAVRFRGALPHVEVAAAMRRASFLVHASHWENLPNVLIEAQATGLPVVATRVGGVPEIVGPEEGILVPPGNVAALARALEEMCGRHGEFDSERLSREAGSRFGFEAVADRWTEVYEEVLAAR